MTKSWKKKKKKKDKEKEEKKKRQGEAIYIYLDKKTAETSCWGSTDLQIYTETCAAARRLPWLPL